MMEADQHGQWVRYSDYEKLEAVLEKRDRELQMMDYERAKEADRADQARNQERQRIQEALEDDAVRKAATEAAARERSGDGPGCGCDQCLALSTVRAAFAALDTHDPSGEAENG
jgi:hypothetical protein